MEHVYLFLSIFKYYCIVPVFIFDGKPPAEKTGILKQRYAEKHAAYTEYTQLETATTDMADSKEKDELLQKMNALKKKMTRVTYFHIDQVIELINAFGFEYYLAPHEADQLCSYLTITRNTYAVLSDDMDFIVAGCPFVIRNMNLATHEATMYNTEQIMAELAVPLSEFRKIIVLSGTDYNLIDGTATAIHIRKSFEYYQKYMDECANIESVGFYDWLMEKGIINSAEFDKICNLFDITYYADEIRAFLEANTKGKSIMSVPLIKTIMRKHKFIFV